MAEKPVRATDDTAGTTRAQVDQAIGRRIVAWTRFIAIIPVLGLLIGSVTLVVVSAIDTVQVVMSAVFEHAKSKEIIVHFIEIADSFLLGIVLYVIALGIFELFIDDRVPLPSWLEFHTLDDLKQKLVGVVVVVLAVFFLGRVIDGSSDFQSLAYLGIGIGAVILSVGYFIGKTHKSH